MTATAPTLSVLATQLAQTSAANPLWGIPAAAQGLLIASLQAKQPAPTLVLCADSAQAQALYDDLALFSRLNDLPAPLHLPAWETLPHEFSSPLKEIAGERMATLLAAANQASPLVIAPVAAVLHRLPTPDLLARFSLNLAVGVSIPFNTLTQRLDAMGYQNAAQVSQPGNYAVRGDILDIYPPHLDSPVRVELFGDEVDTLRAYDPVDQRSTGPLKRVRVAPVTELPHDPDLVEWAQMTVTEICQQRGLSEVATTLELSRLSRSPRTDGIETWAPFFFDTPMATLADHLPSGLRIVFSGAADVEAAARGLLRRATEAMADETARGTVVPEVNALFVELGTLCGDSPVTCLEAGVSDDPDAPPSPWKTSDALGMGPIAPAQSKGGGVFKARFADLADLAQHGPVTVVCPEAARTAAFAEVLDQYQVPHGKTDQSSATGALTLATGDLSGGFALDGGPVYLTEAEIFGRGQAAPPPARAHIALFLSTFDDLRAGDAVVHAQHGIGLYRGLKRLTIGNTEADFLELEYLGGDRIYVAMEHLYLVQKYQGSGENMPPLDRMGGKSWQKKKGRAKKALTELAQDLVELHAAREMARGYGFAPEGAEGIEFAASFPYTETPDQQRAIDEVRADMERERPMDRLVCGDVGYGKTEVAIRAAFKAMIDGKQVVLIAPTTLLAQQHLNTCKKRFAGYPFNIALLSRFQSEKDRKVVNAGLKDGTLDLVIATHKILTKSVEFKRLGLLVVDEEQRFGVAHKERIKQWKTAVDVLTLTATPIPRTLQLSLIGVRDLSIIDTPPPDRRAVLTKVTRFDATLIQEAMERELARGGQVFFVHNRVQDIGGMAQFLKKLLPKAKIDVAHGQMPERQLETVMGRFIGGETEVLLSTSIVESGLDIPRANTIIINRADRFGLAELYQLRGRVGRSATQAYAYMMGPEDGWSGEAKERLMAIQAFTDLGSGFRIAARDLEIRGAGSLLGHKQSGQIAAVGIDAYMELIRESMAQIRGETVATDFEPDIKLGLAASVPDNYITDAATRLSMYKRIASLTTETAVTTLGEELADRFGKPPEAVQNLLAMAALKIICRQLRVATLKYQDNNTYQIGFDADNALSEAGLAMLLAEYGPRIRFTAETTFQIDLGSAPEEGGSESLISLLKGL